MTRGHDTGVITAMSFAGNGAGEPAFIAGRHDGTGRLGVAGESGRDARPRDAD